MIPDNANGLAHKIMVE